MHYYRLRRTGSLEQSHIKGFHQQKRGYVLRSGMEGHPLATPGGPNNVYEHRVVFHAVHGEGPFNCHHCGKPVTWLDMHVDHLDDVQNHNDPENLVPSCAPCNLARGRHKMVATNRAQGVQLTAFGRTMCVSEWARELGILPGSLSFRLKNGWAVERALTEGRGKFGPRRGA